MCVKVRVMYLAEECYRFSFCLTYNIGKYYVCESESDVMSRGVLQISFLLLENITFVKVRVMYLAEECYRFCLPKQVPASTT